MSTLLPSAVVANSKSTLECLKTRATGKSSWGSAKSLSSWVVYDGIRVSDAQKIPAIEDKSINIPCGAKPVIALVGRIAEWKGQHIYIQAAAEVIRRHPGAEFWIVGAPLFGEFDYESRLHELVDSLGLSDRVHFLGFRSDVPHLLDLVTVVVHASCLGEPFGQVVIEGMAASKPVVATNGGALPEIITDGVTGRLVPMNDAPAMAGAISSLLSNPEEAKLIGLRGRQHVFDKFTVTHTARSMERVYEHIFATAKLAPNDTLGANDLALKGAS